MSTTILELRQRDAPNYLGTPGDWETTLAKPIVIEDGDQIAMKSCFLDTQAQSNDRIVIQNPVKVEISNGFYIDMVRGDGQDNSTINNVAYVTNPATPFVDGKPYILVDVQNSDGDAFYFPGVSLQTSGEAFGFPSSSDETDGTLTVEYIKPGDSANNPSKFMFAINDPGKYAAGIAPPGKSATVIIPPSIPFWHSVVYDKTTNIAGTNFPMRFTNGSIITPKDDGVQASTQVQISGDGQTIKLLQLFDNTGGSQTKKQFEFNLTDPANPTEAAGDNNIVPHIKSDPNLNSFIIPSGSYDPDQLCSIVNRQLQLNTVVSYGEYNTSYVNSNYLVAYNPTYPDFTGTARTTKFIAQDLSNATEYTDASLGGQINGALLVGASQMVLDYDVGAKQFMWSYIHMPFDGGAASSGLVESAGILESSNLVADNQKPFAVSRNSGIFFTDFKQQEFLGNDVVITKDGNGRLSISGGQAQQFDFLNKACGFQTKDLITNIVSISNPADIGDLEIDKLSMPEDLTAGVKTTTGYFGLDAIVDRAAADQWWHPPVAGVNGFFSNITGMTIPVYNDEKSGGKDDHLTFGYFLIDIAAKFNNEFTGSSYQSDSIRAIVSRYYQQNSYTIGSGADSVPYIHRGDPVILSSFRCRILSGDKQLAPNLETDNTLMLEIVKAPPQMPQNQ